MHIPIFGLIMIFTAWLGYEIKSKSRAAKNQTEEFWEKERKSGFIPRQSTDDIHFIIIDESVLPRVDVHDTEIAEAVNGILALKDQPIADLSDYTNTDLKYKYGTGNFTKLSAADTNFLSLSRLLGKTISALYEDGRLAESERLATFAFENKVFSTNCTLPLANIYAKLENKEKLDALISAIEEYGKCPSSLIQKLKEIKEQMQTT